MSQKQAVQQQQQQAMKFGMNQEDRKSLMFMFGNAPSYFESMPSALGNLIVESIKEVENFKSLVPKKFQIMALYIQSLVLRDEYKQYLYEKLLKVFGVTDDEKFFAIEAISLFQTFSIFERMTMVLQSKDSFEQNHNNMVEYFKKATNQNNKYDPTALNRCQSIEYGMSLQNEDQCIMQFGCVPQCFNLLPKNFADSLWKKWMVMNQVESIPLKYKFMMISIVYGTSSIKTSFEKASLDAFIKLAMAAGLSEQELIEMAAIQGFSNETSIWIRSVHYSMEQYAKEIDAVIEHHKMNKDM